MTKTFRSWTALVAMLIVAMLVAACGGSATTPTAGTSTQPSGGGDQPAGTATQQTGGQSDEQVEITWLNWWESEWGDAYKTLIDGFEKAHPNIKVKSVSVPYPEMSQKLTAAAASGDTSYDFFGVEGGWIPGLYKQGYIESLDSWLDKDPTLANGLTETARRVFQGETYSTCLYMNVYQFAYNVDIFEEKGLEPPTNWDEFVEVEQALRDEKNNVYGMSMPLQDGGFIATRYMGFRLAQEGGRWVDDNGKVVFNSPEGVRALEFWKDFYQKDLVVPGSMGEDQTLMLEFVANKQVGSIIDGPFILSKARQYDPDIKLAYAPAWKAATGGYQWACSGLGINANSAKKDAVWKFFQYMYSDDVSINMTKSVSYPWATKAAMASLSDSDDPMLRYIPDMAAQDAAHNITIPVLPESSKMLDALRLAFQETLNGQKDAKTALDEAAAVWQESFDSFAK